MNVFLRVAAVAFALFGLWWLDPGGYLRSLANAADAPASDRTAPTTETTIRSLQEGIAQDRSNVRAYTLLGAAYLQHVRETGDPSDYGRAEQALKQALALDANDPTTLIQMGALALARHDFRGALDWGERARAQAPQNWLVYGVIGDAHIELGEYEAASAAMQQMVNLRPDLNSYARVSYVRELYGEVDGAIQAMQWAAGSGPSNAENTNWARVQLGNLYFNNGRLDDAEAEYRGALADYPGYLHARAGLAKVRAARGDYAGAVGLYQQALAVMPVPEYVIALGDVFAVMGQQKQAQEQYALVRAIEQLYRANGVDSDMEMALFDADHQAEPGATVAEALQALAHRPSIHAADVLAWALYQAGQYAEARSYSQQALRLGTHDALKLYHAGMIAYKLGDRAEARTYLDRALSINPHFSLLYADAARQTLDDLRY